MLRQNRQSYRENKLNTLTARVNDSKTFWSDVRSVIGGTCRQPVISTTECFTHFKSVLGNETNLGRGANDYVDLPGIECLDSPISEEEARKALDNVKLNKSPGPDSISAEMLKISLEHIL